jgi:hypothetical protein
MFSELAAQELIITAEEWEINPKTQTATNIRENIIARLATLADRLEARESAPRSKLIGEIESAKFGASGDSIERSGEPRYHTDVAVRMRITNAVNLDVTIKRASLAIAFNGATYRGHNQALWLKTKNDGPDLMKTITAATPIRQSVATVGSIELKMLGLRRPQYGVTADATVTLVDEFERPHTLRNRTLLIRT